MSLWPRLWLRLRLRFQRGTRYLGRAEKVLLADTFVSEVILYARTEVIYASREREEEKREGQRRELEF
jgi:hypothetical protein